MKMWISGGEIEIIHPRDMIPLIQQDKAYSQVQQYNAQTHITPLSGGSASGYAAPTQTYTRSIKMIENFRDKEYFILNSFVKDLHYYNRVIQTDAKTFNEAIEDAGVECLNNFGIPTHAVIFNPNVIIMGQFDEDVIKFKEIGPNNGALMIYMPNRYTILYSPEECPYFKVEPKYGQFVANVLIMETMKRLNLA